MRWDQPIGPTCQVVSLETLRLAVQQCASDMIGATIGGAVSVRWLAENMAYELESYVLVDQLPPAVEEAVQTVEVRYPDGWWEMLRHQYRERWWMRWLVARRPVRWHTEQRMAHLRVDLKRYWTFPRAKVQLPDDRLGEPVRLAQWETKTWVSQP